MSGSLAVSFVLRAVDQASPAVQAATQKINAAFKESERVAQSTSEAAISAFQKQANAREILGIRSEKAIQNEINQTKAAYQRLAESGNTSARELARAQEAANLKIAALRKELDGVRTSAIGAGSAMSKAVSVAAGIQAGKMVLQDPLHRTQAYDRQLAYAANTAYAGKSLDERKAGKASIHAAVKAAVQQGGTPEAALAAYQTLAGSGEYKTPAEVAAALPQVVRAATANGGTAEEFAKIALAAKKTLGLDDFNRVANMATTAGQLGGFEIKDMAKGLPEQLAAAKNAGLTGYSGYASLLALNQAAVSTAGSPDQAANNVVNLLNKINSRDTANDFKKLGIDLDGSLLEAQKKGTNTLEAFGNLVDRVVAKDPRFREMQAKAKTATGDEQKQIYANMAQLMEGSGIGKVLQDRQALMGFLSYRNQHEKYGQFGTNTQAIANTGDSVGDNMALVSQTASFLVERMAANKALAMQDALDKVNPLLGTMADGVSTLITEFPALAAASSGGTLAIAAMGASASTAAIALQMLGKSVPGIPLPGGPNPPVPTGGPGAPGAGSGGAMAAIRAAGMAALPLAAIWGVSKWAGDTTHDEERVEGIQDGAVSPLKKLLASFGLDKDAEIEALRAKSREGQVSEAGPSQAPAPPQIIQLVIDGQTITEIVNDHNARQSSRH